MRLSRRSVVAGMAGGAALGGCGLLDEPPMPGTLGGADFTRGHRLREGRFPVFSDERSAQILIVGGGIAGLSAAWALAEAGISDFRLLELEDSTGGNARSGRNAVSAYPLGAHYLPLPNAEAVAVIRLLERLRLITGWQGGKPVYDPYALVSDPDERMLHLGKWQEGLVPSTGLSASDSHDLAAFFAAMRNFRDHVGKDGKPAFALPMALSSHDPELLALDRLSFAQWLDAQGWRSPILRTHVRYCCRDDYGTEPHQVSAWAGIHYFASRRGLAANTDPDTVLTWPEGNGHLAHALARRVRGQIAPGQIVHAVKAEGGVMVDSYDVATKRTIRWHGSAAILATPRFVTARLLPPCSAEHFAYAPWLTAAVTLDRLPAGPGAQLAWDNVSWTSDSLGYVVNTHQSLSSVPGPTVLTWYLPLSEPAPADARRIMLKRSLAEWQAIIEADILQTNPDLKGAIRRIDPWRWGHAMIRPEPGFFFSGAREAAARPQPPIFFAHSDLSGLSLFEEANYRGTLAAEGAMTHLGIDHSSLLAPL